MPFVKSSQTIQAPGKLVLFGEYAVLEGETALVASVNRFARCTAVPADTFTLTALGFGRFTDSNLNTAPAILQTLFDSHPLPMASIELDSRQLYVDEDPHGCKLGLGSSAAVSAALLKTLIKLTGTHQSLEQIFTKTQAAHRKAQGLGSGIDVAAAVFGGVFEYQLRPSGSSTTDQHNLYTASTEPHVAHIRRCSSDVQSAMLGVHLGQAASTPMFVRAVQTLKTACPSHYHAHIQSLGAISSRACEAWAVGDIDKLIKCCAENNATLRAFGNQANVSIVPSNLETLNQRLKPLGSIAKTTGAGGGDMAWVVCRDVAHAREIERQLSVDWPVYPLSPSPVAEGTSFKAISGY